MPVYSMQYRGMARTPLPQRWRLIFIYVCVCVCVSDFGRLRSYGHFLIPVYALV